MRPVPLASMVCGLVLTGIALPHDSPAVETILQNDGFMDGQSVFFQGGFEVSEMAASRFTPTGTGPWRLNRILFLFGGNTATETFTLRIWDDAAGTLNPGSQLFFGDYEVTGSSDMLHEINLVASNVIVNGQFRVGFEFQHSGFPSVARDGDGTIQASKNFIFSGAWFQSSTFGLTGDWIIRAGVEPQSQTDVDPSGPLALALARLGPSPSAGSVRLSVTLPTDDPASLDLLDVTGRRVASRSLGSLGPGRHSVNLVAEGPLKSGVYFALLRHRDQERMVRVVVAR